MEHLFRAKEIGIDSRCSCHVHITLALELLGVLCVNRGGFQVIINFDGGSLWRFGYGYGIKLY